MQITEVRVKLMEDASERLQAFCSITFDDAFVVRDLKIIEGANGPFVAMPSRKLTAHCPSCGCKNHLRSGYCNQCGGRLNADRGLRDEDGRTKLYADIAHPINSTCREMIQERVIAEFRAEQERAKLPGYVSRYEDLDLDDGSIRSHSAHSSEPPAPHHRPSAPASGSRGGSAPAVRPSSVSQSQPAEHLPRAPHRPAGAPAPRARNRAARRACPVPGPRLPGARRDQTANRLRHRGAPRAPGHKRAANRAVLATGYFRAYPTTPPLPSGDGRVRVAQELAEGGGRLLIAPLCDGVARVDFRRPEAKSR